ncbi:MAG: hypothetical protein FDZ75_09340 [Actinobacteria bacterium]|nr:MAG: hypothetical protein FDZ75_09340 [Actinomycetota bacterium]
MLSSTQIIGVAVAVILTVGAVVGLQILDARIVRARFDPDEGVDELEFGEDREDAAPQAAVKIVPRSTNGRQKKRRHGR